MQQTGSFHGDGHGVNPLLPLAHKMLGQLGLIIVGTGIATAVDFTKTITLGSVILGAVILVGVGIVTARSKIAVIWREEAQGERAAKERLQEELAEEKASRAAFEREQQEIRHELKGELAACKAQLKVMEAKTDLTTALESIRKMNEETVTTIGELVVDTFVEKSKQEHAQTHKLLSEIRDKLPSEPIEISVPDIHEVTGDG